MKKVVRKKPKKQIEYGPRFFIIMGITIGSAFGFFWIVGELLIR